ncbi:MAG: DNA internalization-related competence protein ComEC/Rec2 [Gammaproteobacteria bacterium]|nr:DNA internalization-related competence protein ComEC/Rec2 [Gammaproteobacteria bacterium]
MLLKSLSFLAGVMLIQQLAELPDVSILIAALFLILSLATLWWFISDRRIRYLLEIIVFVLLGSSWASLFASEYLAHKLPESLAGQEFVIEGSIRDIPVEEEHVQRFMLDVERFEIKDKNIKLPEHLRLSWYYGPRVNAGERWRLLVRLKPPHGFMNPGGFDYEGWLYQQNIHSTGYVRDSDENFKLADAGGFSLAALRQRISKDIQSMFTDEELVGLITALAVGDRSPISDEHWDTLIRTGTNHLMAISGLHIGLAAAFGFWVVRRLVPVGVMKYVPAQQLAILGGLSVALVYALLAGLSIPTQRALLMLSCFVVMLLLKRNFKPINAMATALFAILLWNPVSALSAGFWFSFLAVSVIFYVFSGRLSNAHGIPVRIRQWGLMQFSIALALFPFSLLLFQQTSLISPLANLILVPYVSFLVVPLVLLALLTMPVSPLLSGYLLIASNKLLAIIWPVIEALSQHPWAYWVKAAPDWPVLLLALVGVALLLAPRGFPVRWLGLVMLLPIILNSSAKPAVGNFEMSLLDVGQGLSVAVRTRNHSLVFDAGNKFGSRLDAGDAVVLPFLRHWSVDRLDKLVISHGDADHIGGAQAIVDVYPEVEVIGRDIEPIIAKNKHACLRAERWQWDDVEFEFLHPDEQVYTRRNNHACVLKVTGKAGRLLIASDIEDEVEIALIKSYAKDLQAEVLVVPHHGSKTSSSQAFIDTVKPEIALFPVGYRNRYHHPKAEVVERYRTQGAAIHYSGHVGEINVLFEAGNGTLRVNEYRTSHRKYWNHVIAE